MTKIRILTAVLGLPLLLSILYIKGTYLYVALLITTLIGLREFYNSSKLLNTKPIEGYGYVFTIVYLTALYVYGTDNLFGPLLILSFLLLMAIVIFNYKNTMNDVVVTVFGVFYVTFFFGHFISMLHLRYADILIFLPFITAFATDTCAYVVGLTIGKHKLCPKISPKKSVEGAIGGFIGCMIFTVLYGIIVSKLGYRIETYHFAIVGLICGVTAQFGDLMASMWKRYTGIKDFGNILPGHGGVMDRFDSVLFTLPIIYYYFSFLIE